MLAQQSQTQINAAAYLDVLERVLHYMLRLLYLIEITGK